MILGVIFDDVGVIISRFDDQCLIVFPDVF